MDAERTDVEARRQRRFWKTWRTPVKAVLKSRFLYDCKTESVPDGPFLLYVNHVTDLDPLFVAASFSDPLVFVAGETVHRMGLLSEIIRRYAATIDRIKGSTDTTAALTILKALKNGRRVCMFPSGNRSFCGRSAEIPLASAKLAKIAKVPLLTYRIEGGYMTSPRWADRMRRGHMRGRIVRVYTPQELAVLSVEELHRGITNDLYEDAYASEPTPYTGKRLAERLETMLYLCPRCGCVDTLKSRDDTFFCTCGLSMRLNAYGRFEGEAPPFLHPGAWDDWQQERMRILAASAGEAPVFSDEGQQLYRIGDDHKLLPVTAGTMQMSGTTFSLGRFAAPLDRLEGFALTQQEKLTFSMGGEHYVIRSDHPRCGKKYYDLFRYRKAPKA